MAANPFETVDGDHEGDAELLEVVDCEEGVGQPFGVHQHHRADGAAHQVVPHELETLLAGGAEQVEHQVRAQGDTPEIHGHRGGRLVGEVTGVVDPVGHGRHRRFRGQRQDLRHRPDEGGLSHPKPAGDDDLDRKGNDLLGQLGRIREP